MNNDDTLDPYQRLERSAAEHDLIRSLFNSTPAITTEPDSDPDGDGWLDDEDLEGSPEDWDL